MDDALLVRASSASAIWRAIVERLGERQRAPRRESLGERLALDELEDERAHDRRRSSTP